MKKFISVFAAIAVVLTMAGCSAADSNRAPGGDKTDEGVGGIVGGIIEGITDTFGGAKGETAFDAEVPDGVAPTAPGGATGGAVGGENSSVQPQSGLLTGGEWKDNAHWADWNALYKNHEDWNSYKSNWRIGWDTRISVKVTADGKPAANAKVSCKSAAFSSVTDNNGTAYLFFNSEKSMIEPIYVEYNSEKKTLDLSGNKTEYTCEFSTAANAEKPLDLMIMCDTTGSMSDELEYLKAELSDIIKRIKNENANLTTRVSVNFYRDEGDEYVVRPFDFTTNIDTAVSQIKEQSAKGGGDFPEAVHTALNNAVNQHQWNENSVKIMFLVLDAPAHSDQQVIDSVNNYVAQAAEKGIRIIPVASSGIDKSTEYLLRTMAIQTNGTYTFLTNDSGIGGEHIEPTVGAFNVEKLGDMMARIVGEYLK